MNKPIFGVQYLETMPVGTTSAALRHRLRDACLRLPIKMVLLGWDLPPNCEEAVAEEALIQGAELYRWQPWLTGDSRTILSPAWATIGANSIPISGYNRDPTFSFVCPNHSELSYFLDKRLENIALRGFFQGIFLDRIRFPSLGDDLFANLGCFCHNCIKLAAYNNLDLEAIRYYILSARSDKILSRQLVCGLLGTIDPSLGFIEAFLDFRAKSITRIIAQAKRKTELLGLSLGLDCFSPTCARMVGQDLQTLNDFCNWIKVMIYPRVFGPAGLPYEMSSLISCLIMSGWTEQEVWIL